MSQNSPMGQPGMKLPLRRPNQEEPAPTTPRWPPPHNEAAAQQPDYGQQGQAPQQGYYFPQAAPQGFGQHAGPDYAAQAPGQPLPFNRFPQPAAEPEPNYGYGQQGAEPPFGTFVGGPGHQQASGAPPWSQQSDARGYDLGTYAPAAGQTPGYDAGQDPSPFAGQHGYAERDNDYDEAFAEEEEPPASSRRGLMIVIALVGAIGLGGGMAYAYKTFLAPRSGPAVVIKDTQGPTKSKPEVADGKGFPHTDKKLLARLGEDANRPPPTADAPAGADASGDRLGDDPNGPRRVRTIQIMPGGPGGPSPSPPPAAVAAAPPQGPGPMIAVPGVTLENFGTPRPPPQAARQPVPQQPAPASAARIDMPPPAAAPPARTAQPPVRPVTASAMPQPAPPSAAKPEKAAVPKPKPPAVPATAGAGPSTGSGYVAVLSSKKTRMDALKVFADMQQKYGDVLSSKTPDVQEADLGEKGVWYRAVVGPPGSREAAANLCTQLKSAGHDGCWVTAY